MGRTSGCLLNAGSTPGQGWSRNVEILSLLRVERVSCSSFWNALSCFNGDQSLINVAIRCAAAPGRKRLARRPLDSLAARSAWWSLAFGSNALDLVQLGQVQVRSSGGLSDCSTQRGFLDQEPCFLHLDGDDGNDWALVSRASYTDLLFAVAFRGAVPVSVYKQQVAGEQLDRALYLFGKSPRAFDQAAKIGPNQLDWSFRQGSEQPA